MEIDVFTLFPDAFEWFERQRHVANALARGHRLGYVNYRDHTPLSAGQVDDTPFGGGAGMVLRVDVVEAALRARTESIRCSCAPSAASSRSPRAGALLDDELVDELAARAALTLLSRSLRGLRPARARPLRQRRGLDRALRAGGRRARRDGRLRRRAAQASRRARPRGLGARGVVQQGARGRARVSPLHASRRVPRLGGARRCCSPGHHARVRSGGSSRAARGRRTPRLAAT